MKKCKYCSKKIIVNPKRSKKQNASRKFCDKTCFANYYRVVETITCKNCGKSVTRKKRSDTKSSYCSTKCAILVASKIAVKVRNFNGENNPAWKTGKTKMNTGYIRINTIDELEHRKVMEESIGRKLKKGEVVHHINRDRTDNRLENLILFSSQAEHMREHIKNKDIVLRNWNI